jgi:hypothetical protein
VKKIRSGFELSNKKFLASAGKILQNDWIEYLSKNPKNTILQFGHSEGVIIMRNAFIGLPKEYSNRITAVCIAPGGYIDDDLCNAVYHYRSKGDIVPKFDKIGRKRNSHNTTVLKRYPDAKGIIDHSFDSPTYIESLQKTINNYLEN